MSLLDGLIGLIVPHDCLGCGAEGRLLCTACIGRLRPAPPCCYRCRQPAAACLTCADCRDLSPLRRVQAVTTYQGLAKNLIWKLKFGHAQQAAREIAPLMSRLITRQRRDKLLIVPIPTATSRIRQRGYDQARLLARELARQTGQPYADALARQNQAHQVGASRGQRLEQLAAAFRVAKPHLIRDACVILIDDVVTTGATLEAAAKVLQAAGVRQIDALVFAQPRLRHRGAIK
jgi:ComF family protein